MKTLKCFYENHFGFKYNEINSSPFNKAQFEYWQWRDYQLPIEPIGIIDFGVKVGFFNSRSDGFRKLKGGAIRVGLNDEKTGRRQCAILRKDRAVEPNDLIRVGMKMFGFVPRKPTFKEELFYLLEQFVEKITV